MMGHRVPDCPIGLEVCYPSCYWRGGDRCYYPTKPGRIVIANRGVDKESCLRMLKLETKVFELYSEKYKNITELAQAMEISAAQVYRVRVGKRGINEKFIVGAIKAFPEYSLKDLFYVPKEG
ncbi:hypothetical protein ES703_108319 [subsurface metagenome]